MVHKSLSFLLLACLLMLPALQAQETYLAKVWKDGQYGFIDVNGQEVVPEIYDDVKFFSEGLLPVNIGAGPTYPRKGGLWGFCNHYGSLVIKMKYQDVGVFKEGLAPVKSGGKWGFVNKGGHIAVPLVYDAVGPFCQGLAAVKSQDKWGYVDPQGNMKIQQVFDTAFAFNPHNTARVFVRPLLNDSTGHAEEGFYGLIDLAGNYVLPPEYQEIGRFSEGLARIVLRDSVGYINDKVETVVPPTFAFGGDFREGMARVSLEETLLKDFDTEAEQVLYDSLLSLLSDLTISAGKDKEKLRKAFSSSVGRKIASMQAGNWISRTRFGFIDKNGSVVIPLKYDWAGDFEKGMARVRAAGFGYIDLTGKEVIPPRYRNIKRFEDDVFIVMDEYGVKAVDPVHTVIVPERYQHLRYCGDNLFIFSDVDRQGLIFRNNIENEIILDPAFEEIVYLDRERFKVKRSDGLSGIINPDGSWVVEPVYDHIVRFEKVNE